MPREYSIEDVPTPNDQRVRIRQETPTRLAVLTFSGLTGDRMVSRRTKELLELVRNRNLEPIGAPILARYDPPWTPWFARRNEMMIAV